MVSPFLQGYCMGYPRFGAILALILVRLCIGRGYSWEAPEVRVLCLVFLAEMVEDRFLEKLLR